MLGLKLIHVSTRGYWCFRTVLSTHHCISSCLWVNISRNKPHWNLNDSIENTFENVIEKIVVIIITVCFKFYLILFFLEVPVITGFETGTCVSRMTAIKI